MRGSNNNTYEKMKSMVKRLLRDVHLLPSAYRYIELVRAEIVTFNL
jgi:hypothetical protein